VSEISNEMNELNISWPKALTDEEVKDE